MASRNNAVDNNHLLAALFVEIEFVQTEMTLFLLFLRNTRENCGKVIR